jgi:hypothetical protein
MVRMPTSGSPPQVGSPVSSQPLMPEARLAKAIFDPSGEKEGR